MAGAMYPERIRDPKFRQDCPKRVDYAQLWVPPSESVIPPGSDAERDLITITRAIGNGYLLPPHCYRPGVETNDPPDRLLADMGIKHLHLGGRESDALLFLIEYETFALFLDIKSHRLFDQEPPGSRLASLHHNAIRRADILAAAERAERAEEKKKAAEKAASGLLPKRER